MYMTTDTDRHQTHRNRIDAKANRALELIEAWAAEVQAERTDALEQIRSLLTTPATAEIGWAALAAAHREAMPEHPGRDEFLTSRPTILAKLDARIWVAPVTGDPFDGLVF